MNFRSSDTFSDDDSTLVSPFFLCTLFNDILFGSTFFVDPYAVCGRENRPKPFLEGFGALVGEEKTFGGVWSCG